MQLRLAARKLADQLSQVEEMEARLEGMLENGRDCVFDSHVKGHNNLETRMN